MAITDPRVEVRMTACFEEMSRACEQTIRAFEALAIHIAAIEFSYFDGPILWQIARWREAHRSSWPRAAWDWFRAFVDAQPALFPEAGA